MDDEELLTQYIMGNHDTVRAALENLEPLDAAATAVKLYQELLRDEQIDSDLFIRRLNLWSQS
jgi:hypothetical protein